MKSTVPLLLGCWLAMTVTEPLPAQPALVLEPRMHRLGVEGAPEWSDSPKAQAQQLEVTFEAEANARPCTLLLRQAGVKFAWPVLLNGRKIGTLSTSHQALVHTLVVPPQALRTGRNTLAIPPMPGGDDIEVGDLQLLTGPPEEALAQATVAVTVTDAGTGKGIPCRISIADDRGALAALLPLPDQSLAARAGVVYTGDGTARIGLRPGAYTVYASRGFEYGVDSKPFSVEAGEARQISLAIRHEVPTPGLAASDTHIHTLTFSKHGDATLEERMLTIAGEGIELPIATDHNVHVDYSGPAAGMGLAGFFTPVMGNEVTTKVGHFNAFPIAPDSPVPDFNEKSWPQLMRIIRATPGVKVITLNHPRDLHSQFVPLGSANFDAATGKVLFSPEEAGFDAMEVITSAAMQSDIMLLYHDWFALLNHGHRITAVASSDTHDVSRFVLGQARSYVACDDRDPAKLSVDEACRSFIDGRVLVSMGLLTQMTVNDTSGVGALASGLGESIKVVVRVTGPSWTQADRVELYANGIKIREQAIALTNAVEKAVLTWTVPRPRHDVHWVAVASGPGVSAPYYDTPRPYQPSSRTFLPRVIGSTNPIWIDGDGDGRFTTARAYAERLVAESSANTVRLLRALSEYDEAVAVQAAAMLTPPEGSAEAASLTEELEKAPPHIRAAFARVRQSAAARAAGGTR
jgi:hypothetical protein